MLPATLTASGATACSNGLSTFALPYTAQALHFYNDLCRVGILAGVFDYFVKPFPRQKPWLRYHDVIGDSAFAGSMMLSDIMAANWTSSNLCGSGHTILYANPTSLDSTPPILVRHNESSTEKRAVGQANAPCT